MKKFFLWVLKFLVLPVVLIIALMAAFLFWGTRQTLGDCPKGHLAQVSDCEKDASFFTFQGSGWYYFLAEGPVAFSFCQAFFKDAVWLESGAFEIQRERDVEKMQLKKVACDQYFTTYSGHCYQFDRLTSNANSHLYFILRADDSCQQGNFFIGSKRTLKEGSIVKAVEPMVGG